MAQVLISDKIVDTALIMEWKFIEPVKIGQFSNPFTTQYFTDSLRPLTVDGQVYYGAEKFLNIAATQNSLDADQDTTTITINLVGGRTYDPDIYGYDFSPSDFTKYLLDERAYKVKGSSITIKRVFLDDNGNIDTAISPNPMGRFYGFVKTFTVTDTEDPITKQGSNIMVLNCLSKKSFIYNSLNGRATSSSQAGLTTEMREVKKLADAKLDWGQG